MLLALSPADAFAQDGEAPGVDTAQELVADQPDPFEMDEEQEAEVVLDLDTRASPAIPERNAAGERQIGFEATELVYDQDSDTVTAGGNVILRSGDQSLRADAVTWNRQSGEIVATGAVRLVDEDGNQLFSDRLVLTDELEAGAMDNLLLAFRQGGRLAAANGQRTADGDILLERAAYSGCAVVDADGCDKTPSWRITAERVWYDAETDRIRFSGAYLELFGARLLPLPGLTIRADGSASSGFFVPDIGLTASNGIELTDSYYMRLAENRDLLLSGYLYTEAAPMVSAQYRHLTGTGAYQVTGYATYGSRIPLSDGFANSEKDFRGYLFANGRFQLDPNWTFTGSARLASDRTFLRRYDISREDRIRSVVQAERIDDNSYVSIAGWATQALLVSTPQGQVPLAAPLIDARYRLQDPLLGGTVELQANTLAITRGSGQDTQRAFARAQWDLRRLTNWGQLVTLTALVRGDVYHSDENDRSPTPSYRGLPGWQARGIATAAVDVQWPLVGAFAGGTQTLTPRLQLVASPAIRNLEIPNEDSRAIDLEDSNLFALNRFPGYDRVEDGVRLTYGADWQFTLPGWRVDATLGQSYRLSDEPTLFPDGTGLNEQFSDFVGRTQVRYEDFVKFTHRYRLDKDNFAVRRNEVDATVGSDRTYLELGYLRLNRDIDLNFEDLQDREELRLAGRVAFARYWSVFGSAVVNLTDRAEDLSLTSDGFDPLRTRLGVAYADDCLEFGFTWRRDYIRLADAQSGSSFRLYFALRNIGL
ncbi:LPS assembly protein LptD [Erythrobacter arachoides]|uniref:LPS-assembly protein LptD n=2 Tax=Aurantiacibacter arachoides TaxID=1850444 RepID=A0A845A0J6_9SPHN|nr:LPS assembly protein LptD [Aurantiacibacter arachoides]